tara:strand:+ start:4690 stop:5049 length:360 start_codon:yes stop_codon:yes gene_type:complete
MARYVWINRHIPTSISLRMPFFYQGMTNRGLVLGVVAIIHSQRTGRINIQNGELSQALGQKSVKWISDCLEKCQKLTRVPFDLFCNFQFKNASRNFEHSFSFSVANNRNLSKQIIGNFL